MTTLFAMVNAVGLWLLLWVVFTGVGLFVRRALGHRFESLHELLMSPWLGWGTTVVFLQFWHRVSPVDGRVLPLVMVVGLLGIGLNTRPLARLLAPRLRVVAAVCAVAAGLALWLANHTVMQPGIYDSGLYHLNAVRWAKEFALVPGLGNLHGRLAFNNSSFLYTAMLDVGPFAQRSHQVASGFLMWLLLINCAHGGVRLWSVPRGREAPDLYYALCLAPLLAWIVNSGYASSPSPDVPCFVLAIFLGGELLRFLGPRPTGEEGRAMVPLAGLCLLAMVGITVKLTFAAFAVALGAVAVCVHAWRVRTLDRIVAALTLVVALAVLVLVQWSIRGVVLSGYPAYPATLGVVPVDWAIPAEVAQQMAQGVKAWARQPHVPPETVLHSWSWLGPWSRRVWWAHRLELTFPLLGSVLAVGLVVYRLRRGCLRPGLRGLALLPAVAALLVWFLAAPDPRFQGALAWVLCNSLLALGLPATPRAQAWTLLAQALLVLGLCVKPIDFIRTWKDPGPSRQAAMKMMVTRSGLAVYVPVTGDQVWNSELPATPYFSPRLRLRETNNMSQGFTRSATPAPGETP